MSTPMLCILDHLSNLCSKYVKMGQPSSKKSLWTDVGAEGGQGGQRKKWSPSFDSPSHPLHDTADRCAHSLTDSLSSTVTTNTLTKVF